MTKKRLSNSHNQNQQSMKGTLLLVSLLCTIGSGIFAQKIKSKEHTVTYLSYPAKPNASEIKRYVVNIFSPTVGDFLESIAASSSAQELGGIKNSHGLLDGTELTERFFDFPTMVCTKKNPDIILNLTIQDEAVITPVQKESSYKCDAGKCPYFYYTFDVTVPIFFKVTRGTETILNTTIGKKKTRFKFGHTKKARYTSKEDLQKAFNKIKHRFFNDMKAAVALYNLRTAREIFEDEFAFRERSLKLDILYPKGKKHDYTDIMQAIAKAKYGYDKYDYKMLLPTDVAQARTAWEKIATETDVSTKKSRINKKVASALHFNIAVTHYLEFNHGAALQQIDKASSYDGSPKHGILKKRIQTDSKRFLNYKHLPPAELKYRVLAFKNSIYSTTERKHQALFSFVRSKPFVKSGHTTASITPESSSNINSSNNDQTEESTPPPSNTSSTTNETESSGNSSLSQQEIAKLKRSWHLNIEEALKHKEYILKFRVTKNNYATIPPEIAQFPNLQELRIEAYTDITIPAHVKSIKTLQKIEFKRCDKIQLSPELKSLTNLRRLSIQGGKITAIPANVSMWSQLERIKIRHTKIREIPTSIGSLTQLTEFQLYDSPLQSVPQQLGQLKKLKLFNVTNTSLDKDDLDQITKLLPSGCQFKHNIDPGPLELTWKEWEPIKDNTGRDVNIKTIVYTNPSNGWLLANGSLLYRKGAGSVKWSHVGSFDTRRDALFMHDSKSGIAYGKGSKGKGLEVFESRATGLQKKIIPSTEELNLYSVQTDENGNVWGMKDNEIYRYTVSKQKLDVVVSESTHKLRASCLAVSGKNILVGGSKLIQVGNYYKRHLIILYSKNGGASWREAIVKNIEDDHMYFNKIEIKGSVAYAVTSKGKIFKTLSGGTKWLELKLTKYKGYSRPKLAFYDGKHGWLDLRKVQNNKVIHRVLLYTEDGGKNWVECTLPPMSVVQYKSSGVIVPKTAKNAIFYLEKKVFETTIE